MPPPPRAAPLLVVVGGLPATGKTTICRAVATAAGAAHVRLETIEQSIRRADDDGGPGALATAVDRGLGYGIAQDVAVDLLRCGVDVVADSVNPIAVTRRAWLDVARAGGAEVVQVEVRCSDEVQHQRRSVTRSVDIVGLTPPTWNQIQQRAWEPWDADVVIDTAGASPRASTTELLRALGLRADHPHTEDVHETTTS